MVQLGRSDDIAEAACLNRPDIRSSPSSEEIRCESSPVPDRETSQALTKWSILLTAGRVRRSWRTSDDHSWTRWDGKAGRTMDVEMDKLVSLCKRRGFIFPSSEIYGGINGFWDYGPLGVELKRNIKEAWWRDNVQMRDDMVGLDCSIIMNPRVWEASGHVGGFSDPMVDCRATKERYRADQLYVFAYVFPAVNHKGEPTEAWLAGLGSSAEEAAELPEKKAAKLAKKFGKPTAPPTIIPYMQLDAADREKVVGPSTDERGTLTEPRSFNLMFKTYVGALEDDSNVAYLRPETAQGIFANSRTSSTPAG